MKTSSQAALLVASFALVACGGGSSSLSHGPAPAPSANGNTGVIKSVGTGAEACVALNTEIQAMAEAQLRNSFASDTTPYYYFGGGPVPLAGTVASGTTTTAVSAPAADASFSSTNIQVAGVDEMDWVKNDGQSLWTFEARNSQLHLTQASLCSRLALLEKRPIS